MWRNDIESCGNGTDIRQAIMGGSCVEGPGQQGHGLPPSQQRQPGQVSTAVTRLHKVSYRREELQAELAARLEGVLMPREPTCGKPSTEPDRPVEAPLAEEIVSIIERECRLNDELSGLLARVDV